MRGKRTNGRMKITTKGTKFFPCVLGALRGEDIFRGEDDDGKANGARQIWRLEFRRNDETDHRLIQH